MIMRISKDEARALAIIAQRLDEPIRARPDKRQILETIRRIGCLQIDTISVVARSHYLVIWSRLGPYSQGLLDELHHPDRALFEYWGHAASLLPTDLFPYFRRRMMALHEQFFGGKDAWVLENAAFIDEVLQAVRDHGPLSSSHFERPASDVPIAAWSWWGGKPANRALDVLWSTGALGIERRVNFQRHYDLIDRVLPGQIQGDLPDNNEEHHVLATRAIEALGVGFPRDINDYFRTKWGARTTRTILSDLQRAGAIYPVEIDDLGTAFVAETSRPLLDEVIAGRRPNRTTLLSPFDNLVWERRRAEALFNFGYRLECYTPAAKRTYGYFTLPILDQGRFIGRLDPKVDRREKVLYLRSIHLEDDVKLDGATAQRLHDTLCDFATFNGATSVVVQSGPPEIDREFNV